MRLRALIAASIVLAVLASACGGGGSEPQATSSPAGPPLPPIDTRVPVTPTPVAGHPSGTRTGVEVIDRAIEAAETRDEAKLIASLSFQRLPCDTRGSAGTARCPAGMRNGSEVEAVAFSTCDVSYLTRGTADLGTAVRNLLQEGGGKALDPRLYAVTEVNASRFSAPVAFKYLVIFVSGHSFLLDERGVTHIGSPCGATGPADLFHPADRTILAPP